MLNVWPLNRDPQRSSAAAAFARWGAGAVFVGHFFGPLRSVVFITARHATMRRRVQAGERAGAPIWAFVIPKSGESAAAALGAICARLTAREKAGH